MVLAGDGVNLSKCKEYAKEQAIEEHIVFTGCRADINKLMTAFDFLAMPSRFEGLPITLIEAQASGLICYASDVITTEVKVTDNVKFLPLDENVWTEAIINGFNGSFKRESNLEVLRNAGYDIKLQIKKVEKGYAGEL